MVSLGTEVYDGERNARGQRHGEGMARWENGDVYSGQWANGFPHGLGKFRFASGDEYLGAVRWGRRCGKGTYWYGDGGVYSGEFVDDHEDGTGKRVWPNGDVYTGAWRRGYIDGRGQVTFTTREQYTGWFSMSRREGRGTLTRPDGSRYVGMWGNGERSGQGTLFLPDGSGYHGLWEHDRMHGEGTWYCTTAGKLHAGSWGRGALRCESVEAENGEELVSPTLVPMNQGVRLPQDTVYTQTLPLQAYWWAPEVVACAHLADPHWVEQGDDGWSEGDGLLEGEEPKYLVARNVYERSCKLHSTRVNRQLHAVLPEGINTHEVRTLDASATYLGDRGTAALIDLLSHCPNVSSVNLQDQNLKPASIRHLCQAIEVHPCIKSVDLSRNFIAHPEGKLLARLCSSVSHIEDVHLEGTLLNAGVVGQINQRLAINRRINSKRVISGVIQ